MFFPGKEGYLLFADKNENEPQIVGEPGARPPVRWLAAVRLRPPRGPSHPRQPAFRSRQDDRLHPAEPPLWTLWLPVRIRAMVKAGDTLFAAGRPTSATPTIPTARSRRRGAQLVAVSARAGERLSQHALDASPVFDGMIAARGRLLLALQDGSLMCLTEKP